MKQSLQYTEQLSNSQSLHFHPPSPRFISFPHVVVLGIDIDFRYSKNKSSYLYPNNEDNWDRNFLNSLI